MLSKKQLIQDASDFTGISVEEINELMKNNAEIAVADWHSSSSIENFYKETLVYVIGLIDFCGDDRICNLIHPLKDLEKGKKILEFGAGIGLLLFELSEDHEVFYYDLPSKTQDFAKYLAKTHDYNVTFLTEDEVYEKEYDIIITTDVLEHIEKPLDVFIVLGDCLTKNGIMLTTGLDFSYGPHTPMHLMENLDYKEDFLKHSTDKYDIRFYHPTDKEIIYMLVRK